MRVAKKLNFLGQYEMLNFNSGKKQVRVLDLKTANLPKIGDLTFPFKNKLVGVTSESEHFRNIDIAREVMIPLAPHPGAFGVTRKFHVHEGVDLYCLEHEPVYAMQAGTVLDILKFTGPHVNMPWWNDTFAVTVESDLGIINYGELMPADSIKPGTKISQGDLIGTVMTVLKKDKGRPRNMLHFEIYEKDAEIAHPWQVGGLRPKGLLDPTEILIMAAKLM